MNAAIPEGSQCFISQTQTLIQTMLQPSQLGSTPQINPTLPKLLIFSKWLENNFPNDSKSLEDGLLKGGKKIEDWARIILKSPSINHHHLSFLVRYTLKILDSWLTTTSFTYKIDSSQRNRERKSTNKTVPLQVREHWHQLQFITYALSPSIYKSVLSQD